MNMKTKHHPLRTIMLSLLILLLLVLVVFVGFYFTRLQTIQSIEQITDYDDGYNLYRMNVQYDYSLDRELPVYSCKRFSLTMTGKTGQRKAGAVQP